MIETIFLWIAAAAGALARLGAERPGAVPLWLVLFAGGWMLGAAHPDGAWRRALVLGLSVPLAHGISIVANTPLPYASSSFALACLAVVPASAGTYAGVVARRRWAAAGFGAPRE